MAHNGVAYEGHEELHRLIFVFHHPDATKEQLKVIEKCLKRKSLNINVKSMLASRFKEEGEMPAGGHGGRSADSAVKMPRRAASGGEGDELCRKRRPQGEAASREAAEREAAEHDGRRSVRRRSRASREATSVSGRSPLPAAE